MYSSHLRNTSSRSQASSVPLPHAAADTYVRRDRYQLYLHGKRTMAEHEDEGTGDGLPVAPSMDVALASVTVPHDESTVTMRLVSISGLAILLGIGGGLIAKILLSLIAIISNFTFFATC